MMNDVIFDCNSNNPLSCKDDWDLILTEFENPLPEPKVVTVEIKGSDSILDLSETLTGDVLYNNRKIKLTFEMMDISDYNQLITTIANKIHGRNVTFQFANDDKYYYTGRATISKWECSKQRGKVIIDVDAYPYKYAKYLSTYKVEVSGQKQEIIMTDTRGKVQPTIKVTGTVTIIQSKNDFEITLETGTYKVPEIVFKSGNSFVFDGEGTVVFEYRAEVF